MEFKSWIAQLPLTGSTSDLLYSIGVWVHISNVKGTHDPAECDGLLPWGVNWSYAEHSCWSVFGLTSHTLTLLCSNSMASQSVILLDKDYKSRRGARRTHLPTHEKRGTGDEAK